MKTRKEKVITEKVWAKLGPQKIYELLKKRTGGSKQTEILLSYMASIRGPDNKSTHLKNIFQGFLRGGVYPGVNYSGFLHEFNSIMSFRTEERYSKYLDDLYKYKLNHYLDHCESSLIDIRECLNFSPRMLAIIEWLTHLAHQLQRTKRRSITKSLARITELTFMKESEINWID